MSKSRLNIRLFKQVREKIAAAPEAYDQGEEVIERPTSPCGTAACIGGWADILSAKTEKERKQRMFGGVDLDRAANTLGLGGINFYDEYGTQTERAVLFHGHPNEVWPSPFAEQWAKARNSSSAQARIAVAYLDHIIETGKVLE